MRLRMRVAPPPMAEELAATADRERIERLETLKESLERGRTRARAQAARELAAEGPAATAMLCAALQDEEPAVREAAAKSLGMIGGPEAVLSLCTALQHRSLDTREAAAIALGVIGDSRALPHLLRTQRERFGGRSARLQLVTTPLLLAAGAAVVIEQGSGHLSWQSSTVTALLYFAVHYPLRVFSERTLEGDFCGAVIEAVSRIAERDPHPGLHQLVPELRAIADDRLQHNRSTRVSARTAAERLEALTAQIQQLPLPADPASDTAENLPVPVERLPHTSGRSGGLTHLVKRHMLPVMQWRGVLQGWILRRTWEVSGWVHRKLGPIRSPQLWAAGLTHASTDCRRRRSRAANCRRLFGSLPASQHMARLRLVAHDGASAAGSEHDPQSRRLNRNS